MTERRQRWLEREAFENDGQQEAEDDHAPTHRPYAKLFRFFVSQTAGYRYRLSIGLAGVTVATLIALIPLYGTKLIFDNVLHGKPIDNPLLVRLPLPTDRLDLLFVITIGMAAILLLSMVLKMLGQWLLHRVAKCVQVKLRRQVFDRMIRLPLHRIHAIRSAGLASILRDDAGSVGAMVDTILYKPWRGMIQLSGSLAILAWTDWRLLLGVFFILPAIYFTHRIWVHRVRPINWDIHHSRQRLDTQTTETFGGIRVVRGFSRERRESLRFVRKNNLMARQQMYLWWCRQLIDLGWGTLLPIASVGVILYGGGRILGDAKLVEQGLLAPGDAFTTGDLVMFLAYLAWLLNPLTMLASSATSVQANLAGLDRTLDVLEEPIETHQLAAARHVDRRRTDGRITLRDVSFRYPQTSRLVLSGIDLDVQPGEMVALVGSSGSGKTTFTNLIARFYDATSGAIELDGVNVQQIKLESYRRLLGIVEQDIFLFDGTIAQNIGYGVRNVAQSQVIEAARQANAHQFIMACSEGYDTFIGERGVKLSGGQRQRIAIARAILADPRILILDEATSNLDTESERLIQASLQTLMIGRTSFVIAHRLSTITHADRIVVLDDGHIIEQGRHDELLQRSGQYRRMVELQVRSHDLAVVAT